MSVKEIYTKTMKFVWLKMGVGAVITLASALLFAIIMGIGLLIGNGTILMLLILFWLAATIGIYQFAMSYAGYMIKAGHVAIIQEAVVNGTIPENQFEVAKEMVQKRFASSNVYFAVDKLVSGSVKQLQKGVDRLENTLGGIPGVSTLASFAKLFISISLNYVDECCMGYTFYQKDENAFKCAADGVVIYFQNWKKLLKDAAFTALLVIGLTFAAWIIPFLLFGALFRALHWPGLIAAILALMVALAVRIAFIDSYILVKMMVSYMQVAPETEITFDLYDKLCKLSGKFRELFGKAKEAGADFAASARSSVSVPEPVKISAAAQKNFCPKCGSQVTGVRFCSHCGAEVN